MGLLLTLLRVVLFVILAAFIASFITSNSTSVTVGLFPLPYAFELPLYALGLGMLFSGFMAGGAIVSLGQAGKALKRRKKAHQTEQKIKATENELHSLRMEHEQYKRPSAPANATLLPPAPRQNRP